MQLHDHQTNDANNTISIEADERHPQYGNASHNYKFAGLPFPFSIAFQCGPIKEVGVNGVTNEALLAVVIDRLRGFQSGAYACRENALALTKLEEALHWLSSRTSTRTRRGVEGTNQV